MFQHCDAFTPCQSGLDCNLSFNACLNTNALIYAPIGSLTGLLLLLFAAIWTRRKIKYHGQQQLDDDEELNKGPFVIDQPKGIPLLLGASLSQPEQAYQRSSVALDTLVDTSTGVADAHKRASSNGGMLTDDLEFFKDEKEGRY
jgi:hypothetical protein